jgi:hypothetical protein
MQVIWFGNLLNLTTYGKFSGREQVPVIWTYMMNLLVTCTKLGSTLTALTRYVV